MAFPHRAAAPIAAAPPLRHGGAASPVPAAAGRSTGMPVRMRGPDRQDRLSAAGRQHRALIPVPARRRAATAPPQTGPGGTRQRAKIMCPHQKSVRVRRSPLSEPAGDTPPGGGADEPGGHHFAIRRDRHGLEERADANLRKLTGGVTVSLLLLSRAGLSSVIRGKTLLSPVCASALLPG